MSEKPMFSLINSNLPVYFSPALVDIILKYYCNGDFLSLEDCYNRGEELYYAPAISPPKYNSEKEELYNYVPFMYLVYICEIRIDNCKSFPILRSQIEKWFRKCSNQECRGSSKIALYGMDMYTWKPACYCKDCLPKFWKWIEIRKIGNTNLYNTCISAHCSFEGILINIGILDGDIDKWVVKCAF